MNGYLGLRSFGFAVLLTWSLLAHAQVRELIPVNPSQAGMSEEVLDGITGYLQSEVDLGRIAGAVGMVARHGRIAYFESVGEAENDSLFRLVSMTKAVTSVAVMQLVEDGSVKLNDPVSIYLPEFSSLKVLATDGVSLSDTLDEPSIHNLLTHTSGIGYGWFGIPQDEFYREAGVSDLLVPNEDSLNEHVDKLARLPLAFNPGEQWMYGQSLDVLGRVVEVVSGLTLEQYFQERIFRPLNMVDTRFYLNADQRKKLVPLYSPTENGGLVNVGSEIMSAGSINYSADYSLEGRGKLYAGGSGLVGSTMDYMRFLSMLLNKGSLEGVKLLERSTVELMTRNHIGELTMPFPGHGDGFGYGFGVLTESGKAVDVASVGTYSWAGLFNTYYWVDPQEELIGLVMTQIFPYDHLAIREEFKQRVYQALDDSGFSRKYWYEKGVEHGNPFFSGRQLRVNSPGVRVHRSFASRKEVHSSGLARIFIEEDLRLIDGADLYCEIWGGHKGTFDKSVSINGGARVSIPGTGTEKGNCTHLYPEFRLAPTDLVDGYNSLQFACDREGNAWGHFIAEEIALEIKLPRKHPDIEEAGLSGFSAQVKTETLPGKEIIRLKLDSIDSQRIDRVVYQARYFGYDENGNERETDWHGMTRNREPYGMLGTVEKAPFALDWDVGMLPAQTRVEVRAFIYFKEFSNLEYQTQNTGGLEIPQRSGSRVTLVESKDLPVPFLSRIARVNECTIQLDVDPAKIEKADLHVVSWGGGEDSDDYFTLNGTFYPVAEGGHSVIYSVLPVDPKTLKKGANHIQLLLDTKHHGIEILLPGPTLVIRSSND